MHRIWFGIAALLLLALGLGCKSNSIDTPQPDPPRFVMEPTPTIEDTSQATTLGLLKVRFLWQTDRSSVDVLYYGSSVDSLRDSVAAQNSPGSGSTYIHSAPAAGSPALSLPSRRPFFFRVRALGGNGESGFSPTYRYLHSF